MKIITIKRKCPATGKETTLELKPVQDMWECYCCGLMFLEIDVYRANGGRE